MTQPGPSPQRAEDVFADYLERHEAGEGVSFESVCAAHPALAETLRLVHGRWQAMTQAFAALAADQAAEHPATDLDRLRAMKARLTAGRDRNARYALGAELARGAMGRILRAQDLELGREVALKLSRAEPGDHRQEQRFLEEARITGQLDHPGIVPIHELGLDQDGRPYFAMRLVEGRDLGQVFALVQRGEEGWTRTRALHVLLRVCEAMAYAHSKGVVHRDLKPQNVMVGRFGETYVMDWGLARVVGGSDTAKVRTSEVVGTPAYMAPEQARGDGDLVDARADVYAVGALLHHLLSGRMPYVGAGETPTPSQILARVAHGPPPPLRPGRDLSAELCAICERAMDRDPAARYPDMAALAEDLRAFLEVRVVRAYAGGPWAELRKWVQRNRGLAGAILCVLLLLVAGLLAITSLWQTAERHRLFASTTAGELRQNLDRSEFERARMALRFDDAASAENWLWRQFLAGIHPRATRWALWELYSRNPCLAATATRGGESQAVAFFPRLGAVLAGGPEGSLRMLSALDLRPVAEVCTGGPGIAALTVQDGTGIAAVGTTDGAVSFWALEPPRLLRRVPATTGGIRALDCDASGFVSGGDDGRVLWWRTPDAEPELLHTHPHPLRSVRASAAGRWLASGDTEGGILLHDRHTRDVTPLRGSWNQVMGLSFAPDERELWSGGADHQLRVWDLATRTCTITLPTRNATCRDLVHLDAHAVAAGGWWRIDSWRTDTHERTPLLLGGVWAMDHDPGLARLVAAHSSGLRLFDLSSRGRIELPHPGTLLALSGDGRRVAVYDHEHRLRVRALPDGALVRDFGLLPRHPERILLDRAGRRMLLARSQPRDRLRVFDVDSGEERLATDPVAEPPFQESYALRPDGKEVAVARGRTGVRRLDVDSGRTIDEWPVDTREILRLVYSGDGRWLAVAGRATTSVVLCATADGTRREIAVPMRAASIALTSDGTRLASGGWDGEVAVIDVATQRVLMRQHMGNGTAWSLQWSPRDPDLLICGSGAGPINFLDLASERPCLTLDAGVAVPARGMTLSEDGATLVMSGDQGALLVDLTYFERHLAGNLQFQLERLRGKVDVTPERAAELLRDAEAALARPWPRLTAW